MAFDRRCSNGARCIACLTPIFRPPTEEPFFSSMARLASSVTALGNRCKYTTKGKCESLSQRKHENSAQPFKLIKLVKQNIASLTKNK